MKKQEVFFYSSFEDLVKETKSFFRYLKSLINKTDYKDLFY
jgi:hypothetical protein